MEQMLCMQGLELEPKPFLKGNTCSKPVLYVTFNMAGEESHAIK